MIKNEVIKKRNVSIGVTSKKNPTMTSDMGRVYPGSMAPSTVFIPIKITETSTAADIAARVAKQLKLELNNASLSEETPQATTDLAPGEYPFDRCVNLIT